MNFQQKKENDLIEKLKFTTMNKRLLITTVLLFIITVCVNAQNLTPGIGFKDIFIGISLNDAEKFLGKPNSVVDFESEKMDWQKSDIDIKKEIAFIIGFDSVYSYNENKYAIWKVFYKNNKAVFFIISSYLSSELSIKNISVNSTLFFNDSISKALDMLGKNSFIIPDIENTNYYLFPEQGITLYVEDELIKVLYIYSAFKGDELNKIKHIFEQN